MKEEEKTHWNKCSYCKHIFPSFIKDKEFICINCLENLNKSRKLKGKKGLMGMEGEIFNDAHKNRGKE